MVGVRDSRVAAAAAAAGGAGGGTDGGGTDYIDNYADTDSSWYGTNMYRGTDCSDRLLA